jgi:uncharacterized protein
MPPSASGQSPRACDQSSGALARALRGFGPIGLIAILLVFLSGNIFLLPSGALLVLLWRHLTRTPWRDIGYVRPKNWLVTVAVGIAFGVAFKLAMKAIVMPLLGADPVNHAFHFLAGNRALLPWAIWTMLMAGFGEETAFRGFAFERLGTLLGKRPLAKVATVLITAAVFGTAHYSEQGLAGAQQAFIVGLVFGAIFAITGEIWMLMIAHATFDLTAVWMIYRDLETWIAHWVFR